MFNIFELLLSVFCFSNCILISRIWCCFVVSKLFVFFISFLLICLVLGFWCLIEGSYCVIDLEVLYYIWVGCGVNGI